MNEFVNNKFFPGRRNSIDLACFATTKYNTNVGFTFIQQGQTKHNNMNVINCISIMLELLFDKLSSIMLIIHF